ncbi:MAG: hypothetical protein P4L22_03435 [Candidatus Babeliales bacterium]|nr:hypothetical protein [Candidatus Babeliales bacterium]
MKKAIIIFILIFNLIGDENKFVIGCRPSGFFSNFLSALINIRWAEKNNKIPVVWCQWHSPYYQVDGYNGSKNVWEYYFESISELNFKEGDKSYWQYAAIDGFEIPSLDAVSYSPKFRNLFHSIIKKYIKIKPNIQNKINVFYKKNMHNKKNIGIHLRGTDKFTEVQPVDTKVIFNCANKLAKKLGKNCQFFVATDEERLLDLAKSNLQGKVIAYTSHRSQNSNPVWDFYLHNRAILGEEVLIESQLLSKCNYFIHTISNVSIAVCYFNPRLKNILLRN